MPYALAFLLGLAGPLLAWGVSLRCRLPRLRPELLVSGVALGELLIAAGFRHPAPLSLTFVVGLLAGMVVVCWHQAPGR